MQRPLLALAALALPLGAAFAGPARVAQDPPPQSGDDAESPRLIAVRDADRLIALYEDAHGGHEALQDVEILEFSVKPSSFDADGKEIVDPQPLHVEMLLRGNPRMVRLEEVDDGKQLVRLADGTGEGRVWVDGEEVVDEESLVRQTLVDRSRAEASQFLALLDLLYRPTSPDLRMKFEGIKRRHRDGELIEYVATWMEFAPHRHVYSPFRVFYNPSTRLVDRIDTFDMKTLLRVGSMELRDYVDLGGIKFPTRVVFRDVVHERPIKAWTLETPQVNPPIDRARFSSLGQG